MVRKIFANLNLGRSQLSGEITMASRSRPVQIVAPSFQGTSLLQHGIETRNKPELLHELTSTLESQQFDLITVWGVCNLPQTRIEILCIKK